VTRLGGIAVAALALSACASGLSLRMEVHEPATIPAHVFPRVLVRGDGGLDAEVLAEAVVADLRRNDVDAIELGPSEPMAEHLDVEGAVLLVEIRVTRTSSVEARQSTEDPPSGSGAPITRFRDVTVLHARAELSMRDARTEDAFTTESLERSEDETDMGAPGRLMDRLENATVALFHTRRESRDVELLPLSWEEGRAAIAEARAGHIDRAVEGLRALVARADEMSPDDRVALYFDLGQVLRVAALDSEIDLDAEARAALDEAMHLRPDARTGEALESLEREASLRARARAEDEAYRRNRGE
jgi:hypothetical protein